MSQTIKVEEAERVVSNFEKKAKRESSDLTRLIDNELSSMRTQVSDQNNDLI
jgi:hypothetical protein